jgi:multiple sugar transport system substrate-binding protein
MIEPVATASARFAAPCEQAYSDGQGRSGSGTMRVRTILLAAVLVLVPLGAHAADLVVWWEKGWYPEEDRAVVELVAAFEAKTGKDVKLVRQPHAAQREVQAALEAGRPPDFLWGLGGTTDLADQWAHKDQLVALDETLGPLEDLFDANLLDLVTLPNGRTGERALYALPMGRNSNYVHVWKSLLEQAGFTLADIPEEWEAFWSFWCDRMQPAVRRALGRDDIYGVALPMSLEAGDTSTGLEQFLWAYTPDWPPPTG